MGDLSAEEVRQEMRGGSLVVIGCRGAGALPPLPGAKRGYRCVDCNSEVEASPGGQQKIAAGGVPMCVPCSRRWAEFAANEGRLGGVQFGPNAEASLASGRACADADVLDLLRIAHPYRGPK